jgi:hypothetical protein
LQEHHRAGDQTRRDDPTGDQEVRGAAFGDLAGVGRDVQAHAPDREHGGEGGHHVSLEEPQEQEEEDSVVYGGRGGHGSERDGVSRN